nr:MAG TPA: Class II histocompatibility antigen, alpha domain [Caudoviricetes sp.]
MSDSVFVDAFTRYGCVEECIDIDEVAYVDFEKGQICLKAHDAQIPRTIQTTLGTLYNVEKALLRK